MSRSRTPARAGGEREAAEGEEAKRKLCRCGTKLDAAGPSTAKQHEARESDGCRRPLHTPLARALLLTTNVPQRTKISAHAVARLSNPPFPPRADLRCSVTYTTPPGRPSTLPSSPSTSTSLPPARAPQQQPHSGVSLIHSLLGRVACRARARTLFGPHLTSPHPSPYHPPWTAQGRSTAPPGPRASCPTTNPPTTATRTMPSASPSRAPSSPSSSSASCSRGTFR